jgi:hypothetical protein
MQKCQSMTGLHLADFLAKPEVIHESLEFLVTQHQR